MNTPLKIFHINMHHHWGGQPNRVLTESLGLRDLGHEVWIAGPRGCVLVERARRAGLKTFDDLDLLRGFRPRSMWRDVTALRALFRRERFHVVHTHGSQDSWLSMWAVRGLRPRPALVRTRHNTFPVAGHLFNRWHYRQFDWVITSSPQVNPLVSGPTGFPPERITAIFSAPNPELFHPRPPDPEARAELGLPEDAPVIGMVARLAPEKGHHLFLGAAARVVREFPEARFVCVGKGRARPAIEAMIHELGLQDRVVLAGFQADVSRIETLFDICALTPVSGEAIATAILEGFAMGKPVVATQVGGTGESVRDGETGFLIPPGNDDAQIAGLAEGFLKLLRDPALRHRMGEAGRELIEREFGVERLARRCSDIYERLAAERGR